MKRLVVLVMALIFALCSTAMAIEAPSSEKNVKAEKTAKVAAKHERKAAKAYNKEIRKAEKAAAKYERKAASKGRKISTIR